MTVFDRPVGASADSSELEYVAALHQTDPVVRTDGSIKAIDVVHFLSSRYGIRVTPDEVRTTILRGLGGSDGTDESIDVAEIVAILLIPELVKASDRLEMGPLRRLTRSEFVGTDWEYDEYARRFEVAEGRVPDSDVLGCVLGMILHDVTGSSEPRVLDRELVRDMFAAYGEDGLVDDDGTIDDMIRAAAGGKGRAEAEAGAEAEADPPPILLDVKAFSRALTGDVGLCDVESETRITTHYYDVFGTHYSTKLDGPSGGKGDKKGGCRSRFNVGGCVGGIFGLGSPDRQRRRGSAADDIAQAASSDDVFWEPRSLVVHVRGDDDAIVPKSGDSDSFRNDEDVVGGAGRPDVERPKEGEGEIKDGDDEDVRGIERVFTFAAIDYVAGTYRSKDFVVLLWVCGVATYFAYLLDSDIAGWGHIDCDDVEGTDALKFGCRVLNGIVNWLIIMLELSILGTIFICSSSLGNSIFMVSKIASIFSMCAVSLFTIVPFAVDIESPFITTAHQDSSEMQMIYYISLILGCLLLVSQATNLARSAMPRKVFAANPRLARFFAPPIAVSESHMKQAAAYKMKTMLKNAMDVHPSDATVNGNHKVVSTSYGRALLKYQEAQGTMHEQIGGWKWFWRKYRSGALYNEEGIFLSCQIVAGNVAQVIVCLFILVLTIRLFVEVLGAEDVQEDDMFSSFAPKKWMVLTATTVGLSFGLIAAIFIAAVYIPSTVSTTLQFRSGVIPTLQDKGFAQYRFAEEQIALLFGSIFWGAFYTALAIAVFVGLIIFVFVWQVTATFFWGLFTNMCGLCVTLGLKFVVLMFLRQSYYAAFYRKRPAEANLLVVMLQSWNIALATGYVLGRAIMLMLATAINIGRIDRPFLSPGAARAGINKTLSIQLDFYPFVFRKALLNIEAHRHPYLERLGFMYMMKLRYGDKFARTEGSIWRLLFVFALFPWLRRYRISTRPELEDDNDDFKDARWKTGRILPKPKKRYSVSVDSLEGDGKIPSEAGQRSDDDISALRSENEELKQEVQKLRKRLLFVSKARLQTHNMQENDQVEASSTADCR